jgi:acylphosphatase
VQQVTITIHGRVQGVGFRETARKLAKKLKITGFARNEPDGSVYIRAKGYGDALEEFLAWCEKGPRSARVTKMEHYFVDPHDVFDDFVVR